MPCCCSECLFKTCDDLKYWTMTVRACGFTMTYTYEQDGCWDSSKFRFESYNPESRRLLPGRDIPLEWGGCCGNGGAVCIQRVIIDPPDPPFTVYSTTSAGGVGDARGVFGTSIFRMPCLLVKRSGDRCWCEGKIDLMVTMPVGEGGCGTGRSPGIAIRGFFADVIDGNIVNIQRNSDGNPWPSQCGGDEVNVSLTYSPLP